MVVTIPPMDAKTRCTIFVAKHPVGAKAMTISDFVALQSARNKKEPRPPRRTDEKRNQKEIKMSKTVCETHSFQKLTGNAKLTTLFQKIWLASSGFDQLS